MASFANHFLQKPLEAHFAEFSGTTLYYAKQENFGKGTTIKPDACT